MVDLTMDSPVQAVRLYNRRYAAALDKLGIATVGDLLRHFPRRYDDFSQLMPIAQLRPGIEVTIEAKVVRCEAVGLYGRRGRRVEAVLGDDSGTIRAVWFNQEWLAKQLATGLRLYVSGRVDVFNGRLQFTAPSIERVGDAEAVHTGRLVPVYPLAGNLSQNWLRARLKWVVDEVAHRIDDPLPDDLRQRWHLPALHEAMQQVHFPDDEQERDAARARLAFDDLLLLQLGMLRHKREWQQGGKAVPLPLPDDRLAALAERLPFRLTGDQVRATREILADAASDRPMSRLLQGDVGSGKTVVAALAMLAAVEHGYQAALMAPTEILAEQHARTLSALFDAMHPLLQPVLITGSMSETARARAWGQVASGQASIVVGTHALIQERGEFSRLALVVIDEQHRFGVMQRAALRKKGAAPHLLAMTATPIPRTLALTLHGDLDVSTIAELPAGRQEIKTRYVSPDKREAAYAFVRRHIAEGRQAFVICPLVEESDVVEAKAATVEYERLRQSVFLDLRLELVHGQMKAPDKDAAMRRFRDGGADILVATTAVEVGVDVPNATVMLIENAERFGLAQLHQLRGRVGRGAHQSYCILMASDDVNDAAIERLRVVQSTTDGFRLAEEDLRLRGPGSFLGVEQSGLQPLLAMADVSVLEQARQAAAELLDEDPGLTAPKHQLLAERLAALWERLRQAAEWH